MEASDLKGMKELEVENSKLKRMYADMALENQAPTDLLAEIDTLLPFCKTHFSS